MGGTGGAGHPASHQAYSAGPNGPDIDDFASRRLDFIAPLEQAPDAPPVEVGDILRVVPAGSPPRFEVQDDSGTLIGVLLEHVDEMIAGIDLGVEYQATVDEVFFGAPKVRVQAVAHRRP